MQDQTNKKVVLRDIYAKLDEMEKMGNRLERLKWEIIDILRDFSFTHDTKTQIFRFTITAPDIQEFYQYNTDKNEIIEYVGEVVHDILSDKYYAFIEVAIGGYTSADDPIEREMFDTFDEAAEFLKKNGERLTQKDIFMNREFRKRGGSMMGNEAEQLRIQFEHDWETQEMKKEFEMNWKDYLKTKGIDVDSEL